MKDWAVKLARDDLDNRNPVIIGTVIGTVVETFPNLRISILDGNVILDKDQLYVNDSLFNDYTRLFKEIGQVTINDSNCGTTSVNNQHSHSIATLNTNAAQYEETGTIVFTDTLEVGDMVKLTPTADEQTWFVDYKVRKAG